jgi:hypothetical protein
LIPAAAVLCLAILCLSVLPAAAQGLVKGQTIYVPCYSHIYHGIKTRPVDLTITVSIRNTDPKRALTVTSVDYHDTKGALVHGYLAKPRRLEPLETIEFIVDQTDAKGGSGANFMVRWNADAPVNPLLVEAVMIGTTGQLGLSFTSRGLPVAEE